MSSIQIALVIYINLTKRGDRNRAMMLKLQGCPHLTCRSDGFVPDDADMVGTQVLGEDHAKRGVLGIFRAHLNALKVARNIDSDGCFVLLEDDVVFDDDVWTGLANLMELPADWEILLLGPRYRYRLDVPGSTLPPKSALDSLVHLRKAKASLRISGAHFVIVRDRSVLDKIIAGMEAADPIYDVDSFYVDQFATYGLQGYGVAGGADSDHNEPEYSQNPTSVLDNRGRVRTFYWEEARNFGDLIAPWLISQITQRDTVNIKNQSGHCKVTGLCTAGSLLTMIDRPLHIWGAGTISSLTRTSASRIRPHTPHQIYAVRGELTRTVMASIGWNAPRVYGDPALLLPKFHSPTSPQGPGLRVCPHFSHKPFFSRLSDRQDLWILDVQEDPKAVVDQIAGAAVCISTSLHGLIVAQAYGVPYVWLHENANPLSGTNFKFDDFFTTLRERPAECAVASLWGLTADDLVVIASQATLPKLAVSLDDLLAAFPWDAITSASVA